MTAPTVLFMEPCSRCGAPVMFTHGRPQSHPLPAQPRKQGGHAMADLTKDFNEYDAPNVRLTDDVVVFHCAHDGHSLEVSLVELASFVNAALGGE